ncbi:MAG TPA: hypothetical protein VHL57_07560, partial [Flavobacteriales bacterium]|nr:hypothetical protein [Flavobacteriales bacterium]
MALKPLLRATFLLIGSLFLAPLFAQHDSHEAPAAEGHEAVAAHDEHGGEGETKGFDAGKLIMEHIGDEHGWHIAGEGHGSIVLPLPVIIYDTQRGLSVFSSSRFEHGHAAYNGYKLHDGSIVAVDAAGTIDEAASRNIWDVS